MKEIVEKMSSVVKGDDNNSLLPLREIPSSGKDVSLNSGCPLGVSRVSDTLYVCGAHACPGGVRVLRPACVVSAAPELPDAPHVAPLEHYARVPLLDVPDADIYPYLDQVADLIHKVRLEGSCSLVHCVAGVSRSVTLCLGYLMKWEKMTLRDAYHHMKERRPQIRPNTGFF